MKQNNGIDSNRYQTQKPRNPIPSPKPRNPIPSPTLPRTRETETKHKNPRHMCKNLRLSEDKHRQRHMPRGSSIDSRDETESKKEMERNTHLFLRSGAVEGGDGGIEQSDVNRLAQIPKLLGRHSQNERSKVKLNHTPINPRNAPRQ